HAPPDRGWPPLPRLRRDTSPPIACARPPLAANAARPRRSRFGYSAAPTPQAPEPAAPPPRRPGHDLKPLQRPTTPDAGFSRRSRRGGGDGRTTVPVGPIRPLRNHKARRDRSYPLPPPTRCPHATTAPAEPPPRLTGWPSLPHAVPHARAEPPSDLCDPDGAGRPPVAVPICCGRRWPRKPDCP